jgi:hypothetical protein
LSNGGRCAWGVAHVIDKYIPKFLSIEEYKELYWLVLRSSVISLVK